MKEKLTLSIEKDLLLKAKRYSKKKGESISQMFEDWIAASLIKKNAPAKSDFLESFKTLWPNIKNGDEIDIERLKRNRVKQKYGV